ncbi:UDP-glycosyltransferase 84B2 [Fusarium pseudoanthophilum]|uniref:UDP-glycosyltransferase 84B2 n=1 Tax=Fusarium pseudoanthophilum TaxID=48495 RepID=A0A8H5PI23_9HYPO|nr:UDP-glycosyltransferase 84B2 [Fusarium pseudoanthophilum]
MDDLKRILMFTNSDLGQANVVLATAHELGLACQDVEIHIASFQDLRSGVDNASRFMQLTATQQEKKAPRPFVFHEIEGTSWGPATKRPETAIFETLELTPGLVNSAKGVAILPAVMIPWSPREFLDIYKETERVFDEVKPDLTIVEPLFTQGLTFCHHRGVKWMVLSPNTIKEFAVPVQPNLAALDVDANLGEWLSHGPTMYVNLGTHHKSNPTEAHEMSKALRKVLEYADTLHSAGRPVQILWKLGRVPDEKGNAPKRDSYTGEWALVTDELQAYIKQDRVRITDWLVAEPKSALESQNIICSVSHGGANSFYEALCSGIPQALLPAWTDCYDFANRVELLGIGRWANKEAKPRWKEDELVDALLEILFGSESAGMRERAEEVAGRHPEWKGRQMAAQEILSYLERLE